MQGIYKPNSKNTGCACSFYKGRDGAIFINAIQQHSWNSEKKTGSFKQNAKDADKSVSVKINAFECGGLIRSIEEFIEYSMFHSFDDNKTQISFKPWVKNDDAKTKAFGLSIIRNSSNKFRLPIEYSEAIVIREFLKKCLADSFNNDSDRDEE